jgi:hypothetical protein
MQPAELIVIQRINGHSLVNLPDAMKTIPMVFSLMLVAVVVLVGCSSNTGSAMEDEMDIFFPRQVEQADEGPNIPEISIEGTLVEKTGCLIVEVPSGNTGFVPLWPSDYSMRVQGEEIQILDPDGNIAAVVGDEVFLDGVEALVLELYLSESDAQELRNRCPGRYWAIGSDIGLLH